MNTSRRARPLRQIMVRKCFKKFLQHMSNQQFYRHFQVAVFSHLPFKHNGV
jgi:hypothetical protein